ncbi:hypothetical protein PHMEG_0004388 [Phytophthora megakarya]|uniref:Uncharacterized protein n=1 Tax=Phytophthora megakarya TaxID=4795 RepID=A0A225WU08_9STRA|nr:hypothetical protein PHMEG_0004388 [Phytophthora megakarya]
MSQSKRPATIGFEGHAKTPRRWDDCENRQKKSTYKQIGNYTKLFLPNDFKLGPSWATIRRDYVNFFVPQGAKRKRGSSVLKQLRKYYN